MKYGNGGVSIRSRTFVLSCLDASEYADQLASSLVGYGMPEDVFFSRCLFQSHPQYINISAARTFASEEQISRQQGTLAVHDPCRVADYDLPNVIGCASETHASLTRQLLRRCPEARQIIRRCVERCDFGKVVTGQVRPLPTCWGGRGETLHSAVSKAWILASKLSCLAFSA